MIEKRKAFSTVEVSLAAIAAFPVGFDDMVSQRPLLCHFMKGARRLLSFCRPLAPPWYLAVVLDELYGPPFEPLQEADLKNLSVDSAAGGFNLGEMCW